MTIKTLMKDPLNIIVIGIAGQGNVVISLTICDALVREGYLVTFGQIYAAQQRGGSVVNYIRVSKEIQYSPLIPYGQADVILSMEPMEAMRMLGQFGNPDVITIVNPRPIRFYDVDRGGEAEYPDLDKLMEDIKGLSAKTWLINATEEAQKLGDPILANVILIGSLVGSGVLPLDEKSVEPLLKERFPMQLESNMVAFNKGLELIRQ